ncbi:MAG: alpha/beta hydrolase family protein [Candidatus Coproplasma sp.]
MSNILTPISLWKNFDSSLSSVPVTLGEKVENGVKFEYVNFSGRDTGMGRVTVYGAFACSENAPSADGVLIIPDSGESIDEELLKMFVDNGYSALMVDICGQTEGRERYTVYPENVDYANFFRTGRHTDFVDDSADKTSWYEWVAVGLYAKKYLSERLENQNIGVVGIRNGGEVAWKLAYAGQFSCIVPVCAVGWKAYKNFNKFGGDEPELDEERYRFIAGIDSQAYAPYVKCPVLMLCSTNDPNFDYDRAYDTFSRINPEFFSDSVISYSVGSNACIDSKSTKDMFMFLDRYVKRRQVFIPKPAELAVAVDADDNLIFRASFDGEGVVESYGAYIAEDCKTSALRDWTEARYKGKVNDLQQEFYADVYEKTEILFAICYATYSNGFTVWSKITVKKLSGQFRNSRPKCKVMYSGRNGVDCFAVADYGKYSVGGAFLTNDDVAPKVVCKEQINGISSVCGLATYRLNSPRYSPSSDSVLQFYVYAEESGALVLTLECAEDKISYSVKVNVVEKVWQSILLNANMFKDEQGVSLADYTKGHKLTVRGKGEYALNNVMWL